MKKLFAKLDKPLLILTILYSILGLVMIFSSSSISAVVRYHKDSYYFFIRQLMFIIAGFLAGIVILKIPTSKYKAITPLLILGIIASLVGLRMYGVIGGGAKSWYKLGPINIQPTEFAKSIIIMYLAVFFSTQAKKKNAKPLGFLKPLTICIIIFVLVLLQPDLGGAVIIGTIVFFIFFSIPMKKNHKAVFVKDILPETNQVVLGSLESLNKKKMLLKDWNLINPSSILEQEDVIVKIRYRKQENRCKVTLREDGLLHVFLFEPLSAIACGQAAAFYRNNVLLGGGIICGAEN